MNADSLKAEIDRIAALPEIEWEPELESLHGRCKTESYPQRKPMLRNLIKAQAGAPQEAERQIIADAMSDDYFLLNVRGKVRVGSFIDESMNGHTRRGLNLMTKSDFQLLTAGRPEAEMWLNSPQKRIYSGLITDPNKPAEYEGKLNLWAGFGIAPVAGDATPFETYVLTILAQGVPTWSEYVTNWLAWVVQHPGDRIGVVLCLISTKEGTGKGTLGNLMLTLFGQHGRSVSDSEQLTGHFNSHLADALYCFADEAMFAGDLRGADRFKNRITEPMMSITPKGVDSIEMENRLSYLMATNHRFAATVSYTDRRFAMFEVGETPQSRQYWDELHTWLRQGGKNIVLNFLQQRDLAGFHPVDSRPRTPIYIDARKQSLRDTHHWWSEVLEARSFGAGVSGSAHLVTIAPGTSDIEKGTIFNAYKQWHAATQHKAARSASQQWFWRDYFEMTDGAVTQHRVGSRGEQLRVVTLPMLGSGIGPDWGKLQDAFDRWLSR